MPDKGWRKYAGGKKPKGQPLVNKTFDEACLALGLSVPDMDYRLNCGGMLHYCWGEHEIAIVIEGNATREVCNQAAIEGWRVFRCLPEDIENGHAARMVYMALYEGSA